MQQPQEPELRQEVPLPQPPSPVDHINQFFLPKVPLPLQQQQQQQWPLQFPQFQHAPPPSLPQGDLSRTLPPLVSHPLSSSTSDVSSLQHILGASTASVPPTFYYGGSVVSPSKASPVLLPPAPSAPAYIHNTSVVVDVRPQYPSYNSRPPNSGKPNNDFVQQQQQNDIHQHHRQQTTAAAQQPAFPPPTFSVRIIFLLPKKIFFCPDVILIGSCSATASFEPPRGQCPVQASHDGDGALSLATPRSLARTPLSKRTIACPGFCVYIAVTEEEDCGVER